MVCTQAASNWIVHFNVCALVTPWRNFCQDNTSSNKGHTVQQTVGTVSQCKPEAFFAGQGDCHAVHMVANYDDRAPAHYTPCNHT